MKKPIGIRKQVIQSFLKDKISKQKAAELLSCSARTIERYRNQFIAAGKEGLVDRRHGNNSKLSDSLSGKQYYVPPGYIGCRIWIKIIGNKVHFDAGGKGKDSKESDIDLFIIKDSEKKDPLE